MEITDEKLFKMNKIGMWLHFAQGSLMFLTFLAVSRVREFSRGITYQYVSFDSVTRNFYQVNATAFNFHIGIMPALFLYLSAAAHAYILYYNRNGYIAGLAKNINRYVCVCMYVCVSTFTLMHSLITYLFSLSLSLSTE